MFGACLTFTLGDMVITMTDIRSRLLSDHILQLFINILAIGVMAVMFFGRVGYQANFIPFGLDQLFEAPSTSLVLFIHWVIWADSLGRLFARILYAVAICEHIAADGSAIGYVSLILTALNFFIILSLNYCDFHAEFRRHNPYKDVYNVLNFARKHKYPVISLQNIPIENYDIRSTSHIIGYLLLNNWLWWINS